MGRNKISFKKTFREYLKDDTKLELYQKIGILFLIIVIAGFIGWVFEFFFTFINRGATRFYMQGGNILPWMNLYAIGAATLVPLTYRFRKHPLLVFIVAFFVTGLLELAGGWLVYKIGNGLRYWDYSNEVWNFGNIGGFVCLASATAFAVAAIILMYVLLPFCIYLSQKMTKRTFIILTTALFTIVIVDELTNLTLKTLGLPTAMDFYWSIGFDYY